MFKTERQKQVLQVVLTLLGLIGFIFILFARSKIFISDTAWHIKVGEWIVDNKAFPKYDSFSLLSTYLDLNFTAHEWLFGVIIFFVDKIFSLNGLMVITALTVFFSYAYSIFKSGAKLPALLVSALFIFFQFSGSIVCRPAVFSAILVVGLGYLYCYENNKIKKYLITLLSLLFLANFQGGYAFIVMIQFIWIFVCKSIINKKVDKDNIILLCASFIITLINPYGVGIYKYILVSGNSIKMYNTDFLPFSFSNILQLGVVLVIVVLSIVGYIRKKENRVLDLLIMFMYLAMVLYYRRTLDLFNYAFIIYMSKYLSWLFEKQLVKNISYVLCNIFSICLILFVVNHEKLPNKSTEDYIREDIIGTKICSELQGKRFYNTMESGGYLIYLEQKPFIDTRNDVYTEEFGNPNILELSAKSLYSEALMFNLTSKYNLDYLLLERNSLTSQIFYASDLWEVITESKNYVLLKKIE